MVRFSDGQMLVSAVSSAAATHTIIAVVRPCSLSGSQRVRCGPLGFRIQDGYPDLTQTAVQTFVSSSRQLDTVHFQVITATYDGSSYSTIRVGTMRSGRSETNVADLGSSTATNIGEWFYGDTGEIACWDRVLSDEELVPIISCASPAKNYAVWRLNYRRHNS